MNDEIDEVSARLRPFEALSFTVRTPEEKNAGVIKERDGHAALQSALALHGLSAMTPESAEALLLEFGVEENSARAILIEVWQHAYKKLLFRDDHVDRGEHEYLDKLQAVLGLSREEIRRARAEVPDVEKGPSLQ